MNLEEISKSKHKWSCLWFILWEMKEGKKWKRFISELMVEVIYPMAKRKEIDLVYFDGELCIIRKGDLRDRYHGTI